LNIASIVLRNQFEELMEILESPQFSGVFGIDRGFLEASR